MLRILLSLILIPLGAMASALCNDQTNLSDEEMSQLRSSVAQVPFHKGLLWQLEKDGVTSYLFGTMHLYDPRHDASMERLLPLIQASDQLLIELASSRENEILADPSRYLITEGPSLIDRLGPEAWAKLSENLQERNIPGFMAAKFQPWFLGFSMMVPACAQKDLVDKRFGIDKMLENRAMELKLPVSSLDDPMDLLDRLGGDPLEQQVEEMRWGLMLDLPMGSPGSDMAGFYFQGETEIARAYTLLETKRQTDTMTPEDAGRFAAMVDEILGDLIDGRNHLWLQRLIPELARTPSFVAVGALHLPGEAGLLSGLQQAGYTVTPLPLWTD